MGTQVVVLVDHGLDDVAADAESLVEIRRQRHEGRPP